MATRTELNDEMLEGISGGMLSFEALDDGTRVIRRRRGPEGGFAIVGTWAINTNVIDPEELAKINRESYKGDIDTLTEYLNANYITYIGVK